MRNLSIINNEISTVQSEIRNCETELKNFNSDFNKAYKGSATTSWSGGFSIASYLISIIAMSFSIIFYNSISISGIFGLLSLVLFFNTMRLAIKYTTADVPLKAIRRHMFFSIVIMGYVALSSLIFVKSISSNIDLNSISGHSVGATFISVANTIIDKLKMPYYFFSNATNNKVQTIWLLSTIVSIPLILILFIASFIKLLKQSRNCKRFFATVVECEATLQYNENKLKQLKSEYSSTEYDLNSRYKNQIEKGKAADPIAIKKIAEYGFDEAVKWLKNYDFSNKMSEKIIKANEIVDKADHTKFAYAMYLYYEVINNCKAKEPDLYSVAINDRDKLKKIIQNLNSNEIHIVAEKLVEYKVFNDYALTLFQLAANQNNPDSMKKVNHYIEIAEKEMYNQNFDSAIHTFEILKNAGNTEAKNLWRKANDFKKQEEITKESYTAYTPNISVDVLSADNTDSVSSSLDDYYSYLAGYGPIMPTSGETTLPPEDNPYYIDVSDM